MENNDLIQDMMNWSYLTWAGTAVASILVAAALGYATYGLVKLHDLTDERSKPTPTRSRSERLELLTKLIRTVGYVTGGAACLTGFAAIAALLSMAFRGVLHLIALAADMAGIPATWMLFIVGAAIYVLYLTRGFWPWLLNVAWIIVTGHSRNRNPS